MEIIAPKFNSFQGDSEVTFGINTFSIDGAKNLWFRIPQKYESLLSERSDAAVVALLVPAMANGEDIHVDGVISERLYYRLTHQLQDVLKTIIPPLQKISIEADSITPKSDQATGVATGFSAGIDSFCALADHYFADPPTNFELTHLLYHNVGSHVSGGEKLFRERQERIRPFINDLGLPFVAVNSNMDRFYQRHDFQQTHTLRNTAVALLLQGGIGRYLYASTFDYEHISVKDTYDIAYCDPVVLSNLSTGGLDAMSIGSEYTRVEKTIKVVEIEDSYEILDVCAKDQSADNCSTCWKCRRTLLTLEVAGMMDKYSGAFDLDEYRRGRILYMANVLGSDDPLLRELVEYAKEEGFEFPLSSRILAKTVAHPNLRPLARSETLKKIVTSNPLLRKLAKYIKARSGI